MDQRERRPAAAPHGARAEGRLGGRTQAGGVVRRIGLLAAVAAFSVAAIACSDDDDGGDDPGAQPTPAAEATLGPPAIIDGNTFISVVRDYRVTFPQDWAPDENFLVAEDLGVDVFLAPESEGGVTPNVAVACQLVDEAQQSQEAYVTLKRQVADGQAAGEVTDEPVTLGGEPAVQLSYIQRVGGRDEGIDKTDVILYSHGCGWVVTLTHATGDDNYDDEFDQMVQSFTFIDGGQQQ